MNAQHTSGPWRTLQEECDKPYIRVRGTVLGGRYKVANVLTPVYDGVHEREAEQTRANARLIAAAPELLAALQAGPSTEHALPFGNVCSCSQCEFVRLRRAAIAKAIG